MIFNGRTFKKEFSDLRCKIRQPFFGKTWCVNWFYGCFSLSHDPGDSSIQKRTGWLANRFYVKIIVALSKKDHLELLELIKENFEKESNILFKN